MGNCGKYCELKALLLVSPEKRVVGPLRLLSLSLSKNRKSWSRLAATLNVNHCDAVTQFYDDIVTISNKLTNLWLPWMPWFPG